MKRYSGVTPMQKPVVTVSFICSCIRADIIGRLAKEVKAPISILCGAAGPECERITGPGSRSS